MKAEQEEMEKAAGITRGPDGKMKLPANAPPAIGPDGRIIPGGAVVKGPDGKILRVISASGIVRGPDGKIISFAKPPPKPAPREAGVLISTTDFGSCCRPVSCCSTMMRSCTSLAFCR